MSNRDPWWRRLAEKAGEKLVEHVFAVVVASGVIGLAVAHSRNLLASPAAPWVFAGFFALLSVILGFRARSLSHDIATMRRDQRGLIADAAARARREDEAAARATWTDGLALENFGFELERGACTVSERSDSWAISAYISAWSAIPFPAAITVVEIAFYLEADGRWELGAHNPHVSWNPLLLGQDPGHAFSIQLSAQAAERVRKAAGTNKYLPFALHLAVSLSLEGGPPTDPNRCRRQLEAPMQVFV